VKLVIQIPCLNEESTLPATLADLPRSIPGIDTIEVVVVDDGSSDRTSEVARRHGVDRVVRFSARQGLANAFARGLQESLAMGADVIVNTDADNQYRGEDIGRLVAPILDGRADMVIGDRQVDLIPHFSPLKRSLQKIGSRVVAGLAGTEVPDATSGFRAYSRDAAMRITVISGFTYTLETVIQATQKNIGLASVPIRTNPKTRESRLFQNIPAYIQRSVGTMLRIYVLYQPLRLFLGSAAVFLAIALALFVRFLYFWLTQPLVSGHVQSLVVAGAFAVVGVLLGALGVLSDLTAMNRRLLEEILTHARELRYGAQGGAPASPESEEDATPQPVRSGDRS
jgi:glycosyltransferase involved in cell wall biosynthesis